MQSVDRFPVSKPIVSEKLIVINGAGLDGSAEQVLAQLCARLQTEGYTGPGYLEAVLEREKRFPTALPTRPYATAIPHADASCVLDTGVAVAVLDHPVLFQAMDAPDQYLPVRAVLLMAIAHSGQQVTTLQGVCNILTQQDAVEQLVAAETPEEVLAVLRPLLDRQTDQARNLAGKRGQCDPE